jgi:hypothetical protein
MKDPAQPAGADQVKARRSRDDFAIWERELKQRRLRTMLRRLSAHAYRGLINYGALTYPQSLAYRQAAGPRRGMGGQG